MTSTRALDRQCELVVDVTWLDGKKNKFYNQFYYVFDSEFSYGFVAIRRGDVVTVDF